MHFPPSSGWLAHCALARSSLISNQSEHDHDDAEDRSAACALPTLQYRQEHTEQTLGGKDFLDCDSVEILWTALLLRNTCMRS